MKFTAFFFAPITICSASTTLVDLSFDSLPSSQGFVYTQNGPHADDSESAQFFVSGGVLTQATVGNGQGASSPGRASYQYDFSLLDTQAATNFRLDMTARVTDHEQTRQDFSNQAFAANVYVNDYGFFFGIKPGELAMNGSYFTPSGFDGTIFNDYRIDVDLVDNTYDFFLNGVLVNTGSAVTFSNTNLVVLGDGTGTANADGDRTVFRVTANIPEPASSALIGLGLLLWSLRRQR